jgi:hypothetical protein
MRAIPGSCRARIKSDASCATGNGSMDHRAYRRYDAIRLHSNLDNRERKHAISMRDKNSISAIFAYTSKLMRSKNYSRYTTKSVVSLENDYEINTIH